MGHNWKNEIKMPIPQEYSVVSYDQLLAINKGMVVLWINIILANRKIQTISENELKDDEQRHVSLGT